VLKLVIAGTELYSEITFEVGENQPKQRSTKSTVQA
jgi:hypothetical protein